MLSKCSVLLYVLIQFLQNVDFYEGLAASVNLRQPTAVPPPLGTLKIIEIHCFTAVKHAFGAFGAP